MVSRVLHLILFVDCLRFCKEVTELGYQVRHRLVRRNWDFVDYCESLILLLHWLILGQSSFIFRTQTRFLKVLLESWAGSYVFGEKLL